MRSTQARISQPVDAMNADSPFLILLAMLAGIGVVSIATAVFKLAQRQRRARSRVVERPNSHYTSQLVKTGETRHRWQGISLDRLHEVNRAEVVRLLALVEAATADVLRPQERPFMESMAEIAGAGEAASVATPPSPPAAPPGDSPKLLAPNGA
jgi:hypothetical protein